jgi:hypothetical protein
MQSVAVRAGDVSWSTLGTGARLFRIAHGVWSVFGLASLAYIWACAVARKRDRYLYAASAFLSIEGVALLKGRGNCPMGPFQAKLGDPVPFFELVLPPRAAKAAVPVLAWLSVAGMAAAAVRPPRRAVAPDRDIEGGKST